MLAIKFIILVLCVFLGYFGGYLFTEVWNIGKYKVFDFKAFQCRPCLSFHISWVSSTFMALLLTDAVMIPIGIAFAFALWVGLKIDQKNKTVKLEDYDLE